jgi:hypothetical protein
MSDLHHSINTGNSPANQIQLNLHIEAEIIKRPGYTILFFQDTEIAELIMDSDIIMDVGMVKEIKDVLVKARPGIQYFLLVGSQGFFRVKKEARRLGAKKRFSSHLAAMACYTTNTSLALVADLYVKINKPAVPTRLFSSRESALHWLSKQMKSLAA